MISIDCFRSQMRKVIHISLVSKFPKGTFNVEIM